MRNVLRRITFGALGAGMVVAMAAGATTAAGAAVAAPQASAATRPSALTWPLVQRGDHGLRVRTIQYLLDERGANLSVTGYFGWGTAAAVRAFQWNNHLTVDGKVGNQTWPRLVITVRKGSPFHYANRAVQDQLRNGYGYHYVVVDGIFGARRRSPSRTSSTGSGSCRTASSARGPGTRW